MSANASMSMSAAITLNSLVQDLKGIGEKKSQSLNKLGIFTLEDLLYFFPRKYEDRRTITPIYKINAGMTVCIEAEVVKVSSPGSPSPTSIILSDNTAEIRAVWFYNPYVAKILKPGYKAAFYGKAEYDDYSRSIKLTNPEYEVLFKDKTPEIIGKILPVYSATSLIKPKAMKKLVSESLNNYLDLIKDFLPEYIKDKYKMRDIKDAIKILHAPDTPDLWIRARNRLSFDDLFLLQTGLFMRRKLNQAVNSHVINKGVNYEKFFENLKFEPTGAQLKAISEILDDLKNSSRSMNRLLQGDVGSGKTLVAVAALLAAVDSDFQAAFMAPTEILAQQHYLKIKRSLESLGVNAALLTGSLSMSERRKILEDLESGNIKILIGTHAVFSEQVKFNNLGLVIIDEQHRFGVLQKQALIEKSNNIFPHVLVMTATPIPRTLTLSVFGDLDVSVLDELPPGRKPVKTISLSDSLSDKEKLYKIIRDCVKNKNQVYWVCPLVEEGEARPELSSVSIRGEALAKIFDKFKIAVMHGRLSIDEKSKIMKDFAENKINILVSTVVIEVGVDVPNAALIVIEDSGQFGLAQLHQLRGRVGRGEAESMCILLTSQNTTPEGLERVQAMTEISDGFKLAEVDLKQRGPGEICGVRQHGVTEFRTANLIRDYKILNIARKEAEELIERDPELKSEPLLKTEIMRRLGEALKLAETA